MQGHGWCRNPDYEGRDDTVLLRAEELACRGGWQKDSWQAGGNYLVIDVLGAGASLGEQTGTLPIGHGIGSLADTDAGVQAAKAALAAAKPGASAFPSNKRRAGQSATPSVMTSVAAPRQGQEPVAVVPTPLQNHPELGANGEMIRRPSRSVVAEAHRKALERREGERMTASERHKAQQDAAMASLFTSSKPNGSGGTTPPRQPEAAAPPPPPPSLPTSSVGLGGGVVQVPATRASAPLPSREPEDRQIPQDQVLPDAPTLPLELSSKPGREGYGAALPPAAPPLGDTLPAATPSRLSPAPSRQPDPIERVERVPSEAATVSTPRYLERTPGEAPVANPSRYWDDPEAAPRFERMQRPETVEPTLPRTPSQLANTQPVSNVGRVRQEPPPQQVEAPGGRTIRPLPTRGAALPVNDDAVPTPPPARMPRPATSSEARPTEPALPVVPSLPPRQVDEQLLKQLQEDWRERTLAAYAGQRCGTCRYFQALDGADRGNCACPFAGSYRQAQGRQELGCVNSFGTWWASNDDGWLQKTDFGVRQPTPMVDELLREWGIPDMPPSVVGPRRDAR